MYREQYGEYAYSDLSVKGLVKFHGMFCNGLSTSCMLGSLKSDYVFLNLFNFYSDQHLTSPCSNYY